MLCLTGGTEDILLAFVNSIVRTDLFLSLFSAHTAIMAAFSSAFRSQNYGTGIFRSMSYFLRYYGIPRPLLL